MNKKQEAKARIQDSGFGIRNLTVKSEELGLEQPSGAIISCRDLSKQFVLGKSEVQVLNKVNLDVQRGERIAIVGSSGSGKSTLLHLLGGLDVASSGSVEILGQDVQAMNEVARSQLRNRSLGFIYQFHHLLAEFSALENVAMPLLIR
ncbi:MAG: ATP-binding cassette domain-containing protein, partial [Gallionella sp.]